MSEFAFVDASPLILLSRAGHLALLRNVAARIHVPIPVTEEILARGADDVTARAIREVEWLEVVGGLEPFPEAITSWALGRGESSVLAASLATPNAVAIIDDLLARKCASTLGIPVRGTLGIILTAKRRGIIPQARPVLMDLMESGLYLKRSVLDEALKRVGE